MLCIIFLSNYSHIWWLVQYVLPMWLAKGGNNNIFLWRHRTTYKNQHNNPLFVCFLFLKYHRYIQIFPNALEEKGTCVCVRTCACARLFMHLFSQLTVHLGLCFFTTDQAPPTQSSSAPPRWRCAGEWAASSGRTTTPEPGCGTDTAACPAAAPRSLSTPAAAPPTGRDAGALTWQVTHKNPSPN